MPTLTQPLVEQRIDAYLRTMLAEYLAPAEMDLDLALRTIALDAGWVFRYHLTRAGAFDPGDRLLGAPPYFIDKHSGTIHRWGPNTDFWLQGRVYEVVHGLTPALPWPQMFATSDPDTDHLMINLRPNQTLCGWTLSPAARICSYGEPGAFDRTCVACVMAADGIGPWCWTCGIRLLDSASTSCDPCADREHS
jgi:hypothetical protein